MRYLVGRNNLAVTIFVPYDCPNNCPFCTSKKDYANREGFSLDAILESLNEVLKFNAVKDVVITGGEPFANLPQLTAILQSIRSFDVQYGTKHNVFINTTLPVKDHDTAKNMYNYIKSAVQTNCITGLNVSRHIGFKTNLEYDRLIKLLCNANVNIRINSVMTGDETVDEIEDFIDRFSYVGQINFRADYRKIITQDDLRGYQHPLLQKLFGVYDYEYTHSTGCHVCNTDTFKPDGFGGYPIVCLHRGMEHSKVEVVADEIEEINDIIIKQDGRILFDWDETEGHSLNELTSSGWSIMLGRRSNPFTNISCSGGCGYSYEEDDEDGEEEEYRSTGGSCGLGFGGGRC